MPRSHAMRQLVTSYARFYRLRDEYTPDLDSYAIPLLALLNAMSQQHAQHSGGPVAATSAEIRTACEEQVAAGVIEPLTPTDDESIAAFVVAAATMRANLYTALYGDGFTQRRAQEIAETYREVRQAQRTTDRTPSGLLNLLDHYLVFYFLKQPNDATRDELALPVLVACQITAAFAALDDNTLCSLITGAIAQACLPLQRQKRLEPLRSEDIPAIQAFARYFLTQHYPRQGEKRKRLLPPVADLARELADLHRRDIATLMARRLLKQQ